MSTANKTNTNSATGDALRDAFSDWKKGVEAELKGASFEKKLVTRTAEGLTLQPLYTRIDLADVPDLAALPGQAPYLRGTRNSGYKGRPWQFAQEISAHSASEFNTAISAALMQGQDAVVLKPLLGDDASSGGIPISNLGELKIALAGIDLTAVPIHVDAGIDALPIAALYLKLADERGVPRDKLNGSLAADPLGEWVKAGQLAHGIGTLYDSLAEWTLWGARCCPRLCTIGVDARVWGDAGATAVHELAFALAAASDYLRAFNDRGVGYAVSSGRMRFQFAVGPQFFTEIAKFRAWRPLWTRVLSAFGVAEETAAQITVHAATGRWNKTLLDPYVNMLRTTTEALSAVLGGCDSLHIGPFDEVTGATDEFSQRIARNVHTLLAEEFNFTQTADPAGGSWYVEKITDELARKAWALFQSIEARGGFAAALREGLPQQLVAEARSERAEAVNKRRTSLVGTNVFPNLKEVPLVLRINGQRPPHVESIAGRKTASAPLPLTSTWSQRLEATFAATTDKTDITELIRLSRHPVRSDWTIPSVTPWRAAAGFEKLRITSAQFAERTGRRPRVFLAKMGPAAQHKARADFSAGFFAIAGFEVLAKQSFESAEQAADSALASETRVVVICSTDETYPALVPTFASRIKAARPDTILVLAGLPADTAAIASFRTGMSLASLKPLGGWQWEDRSQGLVDWQRLYTAKETKAVEVPWPTPRTGANSLPQASARRW